MGKRELLLVLAFLVLGAVGYRIAAPPPPGEEGGLSWSGIVERIRGGIDAPGIWVDRRLSASTPVGGDITEVAVDGFVGRIDVIATDEPEAHAELAASIRGIDDASAAAGAERLDLHWRTAGESLAIEIRLPPGRRRFRGELVLRIPARLRVRLDAEGPVTVRGVAAVNLSVQGDTEVQTIAGAVTGEHQRGDLRLTDVGGVRLETRRSDVRAEDVRGPLELDGSRGRVRVRNVQGPVTLSTSRADVDVENASGPIAVVHSDGRLVLQAVHSAVTVEAQRSDVSLRLDEPVRVDLTARERGTEVFLPAEGGVTLEAIVREGELRVDGLALAVTGDAHEWRLVGPIDDGGPRIALTVDAGDLVVRR